MGAGGGKDGKIDIMRDSRDARERLDPVDSFNVLVDRVCGPPETGCYQIAKDGAAKRTGFVIGAKHSDSFRTENCIKIPDRHKPSLVPQ